MFEIIYSTKFLKDIKSLKKRSLKDFETLSGVLRVLEEKGHKGLDRKHRANFLPQMH